MKLSHLRRHLITKYTMLKDKPNFFLRQQKSAFYFCAVAKAILPKAGKSHTTGKQLCLPLVKELTCREEAAKHLNFVPLSNDTVSLLIGAMADDVKN